jgi:hypothetical protein
MRTPGYPRTLASTGKVVKAQTILVSSPSAGSTGAARMVRRQVKDRIAKSPHRGSRHPDARCGELVAMTSCSVPCPNVANTGPQLGAGAGSRAGRASGTPSHINARQQSISVGYVIIPFGLGFRHIEYCLAHAYMAITPSAVRLITIVEDRICLVEQRTQQIRAHSQHSRRRHEMENQSRRQEP